MTLPFREVGFAFRSIALAELRSLWRMTRTWLFNGVAVAAMLTAYVYYSYVHGQVGMTPYAGYFLPRYTASYLNVYLLWFCMGATIFLVFDARSRDVRERIAAVLDARPISNLALLGGRLCAVVLTAAAPLLVGFVLIQVAGTVGHGVGSQMLRPVESVSLSTFMLVDAVPALVLWGAWVLLVAASLRNQLAVAVVCAAALTACMWAFAIVPLYLLAALSPVTIYDVWASDLAPRFPGAGAWTQRASELLLAAGFLLWAAAAFRRADGMSRRRLVAGGIAVALGVIGIVAVAQRAQDGIAKRESWLRTHQAAAEAGAVRPDLQRMQVQLRLEPGESMQLDVKMHLRTADASEALVFSFNPGLAIQELRLDGVPVPFLFERGLLTVTPATFAGGERVLALQASGSPDDDFAYLDSAVDWRRRSSRNGMLWLGTRAGLFEDRYVALMPGLRWLPTPGANVGGRGADLFALDLVVHAPSGWLVAAPGRRQEIAPGAFRFQPAAPVAQAPVFAAPFVRHADTIAGVEVELLLHAEHGRFVDDLASRAAPLKEKLSHALEAYADFGIPYPYGALSGVEVPGHLRGYGGGWMLDTVMALPGMVLVREHGVPHARLPIHYRRPSTSMPDNAVAAYVETMLNWPAGESSVQRAIARNVTAFQSVGRGGAAEALDFVAESLAAALTGPGARGRIATAHDSDFGSTVIGVIGGLAPSRSPAPAFSPIWFGDQSGWEAARTVPLARLHALDNPSAALQALSVRGSAVAVTIRDSIGVERTAALLATLRDRHGGYDAADFAAAVRDSGGNLDSMLGDWLHDAALPGFLVSEASVSRLADDKDGKPRYQVRFHVRNDEPSPGIVVVAPELSNASRRGEPIRLSGRSSVELGLVVAEPPAQLWLLPYLSLNRVPVPIALPGRIGNEPGPDGAVFSGVGPSAWSPAVDGIIVDDLDAGFSVLSTANGSWLDGIVRPAPAQEALDHGLPTNSRRAGEWVRVMLPHAWGKYRRTVAGALPGRGDAVAVFETELPATGLWRLDYHVPPAYFSFPGSSAGAPPPRRLFGPLGDMGVTLVAGATETAIDFDAGAAQTGWNKLGEFDIGERKTRLEVSNRTSGQVVVADAVRWTRVE